MTRRRAGAADRLRQVMRLARTEGPTGLLDRVRFRLADALVPSSGVRLPIRPVDIERAAAAIDRSDGLVATVPLEPGQPMSVSWVCSPPAPGSGGHTTMFRMVAALEAAGHRCRIYLVDRHGWALAQHRQVIRDWWPHVHAEILDFDDGLADSHVVFATSWDTAYAILGSRARGKRAYFVQDFEPSFSPAGSEYLLAEATYRFGFHGVTAGPWLARTLTENYGMEADWFDFGCDLDAYKMDGLDSSETRVGICYYCRPSTPRRSHELAVLALEMFARRYPAVPIHVFGEPARDLTFPHRHHGLLAPHQLGNLYRQCVAGLVLSATNVSLVPHEMLAAGCTPVVNAAEHNRLVLANDFVAYAAATPWALAAALAELVEESPAERVVRSRLCAESVQSIPWETAERRFVSIVAELVRNPSETIPCALD